MSWNYPGAGPPQHYGGYPGGGPPGLGPPPVGMNAAPGVGPAPGLPHAQGPSPGPGAFPANFNPAAQMPNINLSAPVIRLGTTGPPKPDTPLTGGRRDDRAEQGRRGAGLGFDRAGGRDGPGRQESIAITQPSREETARTIWIGNITDSMGTEEDLQQILNAAGGLRRWLRSIDIDGKPCSFGFAEYEDADSLATAAELLPDFQVPKKASETNGTAHEEPHQDKNGEDAVEESNANFDKLLVVIDENSQKYIEEWRSRGALKDAAEAQFVMDSAKETLTNIAASLSRMNAAKLNGTANQPEDVKMEESMNDFGEIVNITIPQGEDELSEIPAEMRETVAKEIASFRDRSIRRDMERLRREEELEAAEKRRANEGSRIDRLATPPSTNGTIPSGPRGAPQGPRAIQGVQIPADYREGIIFVSGASNPQYAYYTAEEEESDLTDEQVYEQYLQRRNDDLEKLYLDQERRWLARERQRTAAVEREKARDASEAVRNTQHKDEVAQRLRDWNDDTEAARKTEQYYFDRSLWKRSRDVFRKQEVRQDDTDRGAEHRENAKAQEQHRRDMGMADQFLAETAEELASATPEPVQQQREPARFKMSLGAAASQKQEQAAKGQRKMAAEIEGLLEDDDDSAGPKQRRALVPLTAAQLAATADLTDEEREQARRDLAKGIPTSRDELWSWPVPWEHVTPEVLSKELKPFIQKKVVEYLGVQEDMVVDVVIESLRRKGSPKELASDLEGALGEGAEALVNKLWRMLIFFAESGKRGISVST